MLLNRFSLLWSFRSGCEHDTELVHFFRQIPCYSAGASFMVHGLLMWSFPEFWHTWTTLTTFTLLDNSTRWTLSFPILFNCSQVSLEKLTASFWSQISLFHVEWIRILRCSTQSCKNPSIMQMILRTTFLWLFAGLFLSLNISEETISSIYASRLRLVVLTQVRIPKTIVLFVSDHCIRLLVPVCHDWNCMSLLSNIVHVHCGGIEKTTRQACSLPKESNCRRAACSKIRPILTRETNCLHDLRAFPCNRSLWSGTRTLRLVQFTFAIKLYYQQVMCLQTWSWKDCTRQNYKTLLSVGPS